MKKIAVFASGSGSNFENIMQHIKDGALDGIEVTGMYTDKKEAFAIERARKFRVPVHVFDLKKFEDKAAYEMAILSQLKKDEVEWIILAGYMKLIGPTILDEYEGRMMNIHPSLLPSFPGVNAVGQALQYGCKVTGVTVHFVDSGMDTGKIIDQMSCPIYEDDTVDSLQKRIQTLEYEIYPKIIKNMIQ